MKGKRKNRAAKFLNKLKHLLQPNMLYLIFIFLDEEGFCQDQLMNS